MREIIGHYSSKKVLVVGDFMIDRYVYGDVKRVSPEAPVLVLTITGTEDRLGGAGNTAANLLALGAKVFVAGVASEDRDADVLRSILLADMNPYCMISDTSRCTTVKTRFMSHAHHLFRADNEVTTDISAVTQKTLVDLLTEIIPEVDAVVVSDYNKGVFTPGVSYAIKAKCEEQNKILIGDVKPVHKHLAYRFTVVKPNLEEARKMSGKQEPEEMVVDLSKYLDANVVLTMGADGILAYDKACAQSKHIHGKRITALAKEMFDVTGAGDTVAAVLALSLSAGASLFDAAYIANAAGSVVVQKLGTSTLTREELLAALG